jgi:lipoate-protein ligase B
LLFARFGRIILSEVDKICVVHRLGRIDYAAAWKLQEETARQVASGEQPPTLFLLEHPHTFTLGRRARVENLLWDREELERRGVSVHPVDRGGDITYHGPGQLVGYPILPLASLGWQGERLPQADFIGYLRRLEETLILALLKWDIAAGQVKGKTGVWVQPDIASRCPRCDPSKLKTPAKIASIGVKIDVHGVSRHGFALNVNPDPEYWQGIIPCGLPGITMLSLADLLGEAPPMDEVMDAVVEAFKEVFGYSMVEYN